MSEFLKKIPDSLLRLVAAFAVLIVLTILAVKFLIPPGMKDVGLQWEDTLKRESAKEIHYAGAHACADCHENVVAEKRKGYHRDVSCETCHGPARAHTDDPDRVKPPAPRDRKFCPVCHTYNPSRPRGFPQINPVAHNPLKPCYTCHDPHDPKPPTVPKECAACHGEIARTMAVSHHVQLKCTVCHEAPAAHKVTPRRVKPSKPADREFCGKCHATASPYKGAPKVNLDSHGEKYVCWQCHYPHLPEVEK